MTKDSGILTLADLAKAAVGDSMAVRLIYNDAAAAALDEIDPARASEARELAEALRAIEGRQELFWRDLSVKGAAQ